MSEQGKTITWWKIRCVYHAVFAAVCFGLAHYEWLFGLAGALSVVALFACIIGHLNDNFEGQP